MSEKIVEQVNKFKELIEKEYLPELLENSRIGKNFLTLDFNKISKLDISLADELLEIPEEILKVAEMAIEQFDLPGESKGYSIRIKNPPPSSQRRIAEKRSKDIDLMLFFEGIIRTKSSVLPKATSIRFECPSCGNISSVLQLDKKFKQPTMCGCGRKGKFNLVSKELIDIQRLELEELPENVKGSAQPQKLKVFLKNTLVDPEFESRFNPGAKVQIVGILKETPIILRSGGQSTDYDYLFEAVHIENIEDEEVDLKMSDEDMKRVNEIAKKSDYIKILKDSLVPSIYGHDEIKEGLMLQIVSGVRKVRKDGKICRGDMHILLIGDPGAGKSAILKRIEKILPHARVANGKGATGVGLTASVSKDEFIGGWTFQAGTLVLAHKNIAIIDEFDKMSKEDRDAMHEALEQQTVTISKAGVQARLRAECSLLAGANPKFSRFDRYAKTIGEQIDLPATLINRFDLIFPLIDIPEQEKDRKIANHICKTHLETEDIECELDTDFLRKYLLHAKTITPTLSQEAIQKLVNHYVTIRTPKNEEAQNGPIPITARQLEGLIRMSEAYAKLRLSNKVSIGDAEKAIELLKYCLEKVAFDEATGTIDIDRITTDTTSSQRNKITNLKEIMAELENKTGKNIPMEDILKLAEERKITEEDIEEAIEKLKRSGDIFEPRRGFISRI